MAADALSPTGRVILGMLGFGMDSGYDIKQLVDKSTRHFWAASYGQIYPELKRLEEAGWIEGEDDPRGNRSRRAYRITPMGTAALRGWLLSTTTHSTPFCFHTFQIGSFGATVAPVSLEESISFRCSGDA